MCAGNMRGDTFGMTYRSSLENRYVGRGGELCGGRIERMIGAFLLINASFKLLTADVVPP